MGKFPEEREYGERAREYGRIGKTMKRILVDPDRKRYAVTNKVAVEYLRSQYEKGILPPGMKLFGIGSTPAPTYQNYVYYEPVDVSAPTCVHGLTFGCCCEEDV